MGSVLFIEESIFAASLLPGACGALQRRQSVSAQNALAASGEQTALILRQTGGYGFFFKLASAYDISRSKPDPEVFLKAGEGIGANPAETVVIEDAVAGCQAAIAAGMRCIGVTTSFSAAELTAAGASYTVEKTPEIVPLLEKM